MYICRTLAPILVSHCETQRFTDQKLSSPISPLLFVRLHNPYIFWKLKYLLSLAELYLQRLFVGP